MTALFIFILLILVGWLAIRSVQTKDQLAELESRLRQFQYQIERLKHETQPASPPRAEPPHSDAPVPEPIQPLTSVPPVIPTQPQPIQIPQPLAPRAFHPQAAPPVRPKPKPSTINWEKFLGVKLFAWVGGLALFLGAAFFVKYSFENNWITPLMRVTIGYVFGAGL